MRHKVSEIKKYLEGENIIAAVRDENALPACLRSDVKIIFILFGNICNISDIIDQVKKAGKVAMVHLDMVYGLDSKDIAVDFIEKTTDADGIISTKTVQINRARELGMYAIHRFFVLDSRSVKTIHKQCATSQPDCIEILPGLMPSVISKLVKELRVPVIVGGMVTTKEEVRSAIEAGAAAASTTCSGLWNF